MSRKKEQLSGEAQERMTLYAFGVAAWALASETLILLMDRKIISPKQAAKIMANATNVTRMLNDIAPHPAFQEAYEVLSGQRDSWKSN